MNGTKRRGGLHHRAKRKPNCYTILLPPELARKPWIYHSPGFGCEVGIIPLTQGKRAIVDVDDLELVGQYLWRVHRRHHLFYVATGRGQDLLFLHHLILGPRPGGMMTDHRNGNCLDNRRENLRWVARAINKLNRRLQSNNVSGFTGVYWDKRCGRWRAELEFKGKKKSLGRFDTPKEAYAAYIAAIEQFYGKPIEELCPRLKEVSR